jgi:PAS domain S-box-containing protein
MRRTVVAVGVAGLLAGIAVLVLTLESDIAQARVAQAVINAMLVWSFVGSGLIAWVRRPANRFGLLMVLTGFSWFLSSLQLTDETVLFTIGLAAASLPLGFIVHLLLAFPDGTLGSTSRRVVTVAAYFAATAVQLTATFFWLVAFPPACDDCPENAFLVTPNEGLRQALVNVDNAVGLAVAVSVIVILARRWHGATAPARRALAPVLWTGTLSASLGVFFFATSITGGEAQLIARLATFASLILVPLAFLAGLLRVRLARTAVSRLVLELGGSTAPGRLREAIARALGDPSLTVAYWLPGEGEYVDAAAQAVDLPGPDSGRAVTHVDREGRHIAALVHDPVLDDEPELIEAVCAAAALALENERLHAELRVRLDDLTSSEERLRALIDASPLAIVEVDRDGLVTFWNRAAERLYGWSTEEVIGQPISFVPEEKEDEVDELRERMLSGEALSGIETLRLRKDGSLIEVVLSAAPVYDRDGQIDRYMAVSADISKRKRAEEALRRERDFTSTLIDSTAALVVVLDREGRFIQFNRACERLSGYTFEEVAGRPFYEVFIDPSETGPIKRALERVWAGDFPADNENHWLLRDGSRRLIAWSNTALLDEHGEVEFIVSSGHDITERKRAEAEIRASRARILEAQDEARRKLERNLHDGAQQRLVAISLALRIAQTRAQTDPEGVERMLASAGEELGQAIAELRELARGIHPAVLTDRGLPAALEALAGRSPTPCAVEVALDERLPAPVEAAAYYVVSEALANVAKYAEATSVTVTVSGENGLALVEVADDGIGGANPRGGSGLRGLADRVEALDGRLQVWSPVGSGTRIRAEIPVTRRAEGPAVTGERP